MQRYCQPAG